PDPPSWRLAWLEAVAHAGLGEQPAWPGWIRFELAPQLRHVEPQVAARIGVTRSPDLSQKLTLAHQLAWVPEQHLEQVPFGGRQPDVGSIAVTVWPGDHALRRQVDYQVAQAHLGFAGRWYAAPYRRPHPREQFIHAERFGDVVIGAEVECLYLVGA